MATEADYLDFQARLNAYNPPKPVTRDEAVEAFHNLVGFMEALIEINNRLKIVPLDSPKTGG